MEEHEAKLQWADLLNLFLWHRYGSEFVQDDTAYIAALRTKKWIDIAVRVLEGETPIE